MSKAKLKSINNNAIKSRDNRTHDERIADLYRIFGELKQEAIRSGKVNICSQNKICELAKVNKNYLTGVREFKDSNVSDRYQSVSKKIKEWREGFQKKAEITTEQKKINQLTIERDNLKESIHPLLVKAKSLEVSYEGVAERIKTKDDQITILQDKVYSLTTTKEQGGKVKSFGVASNVERRYISPDSYRIEKGQYVFDKEKNQIALHKAYKDLEQALSRELRMRLYVLVGLPCSGKTTWAKEAELGNDKHPVIYDATNLTMHERAELAFQLRHFKNLDISCVVFDTPMTEIRKRNINNRTADRQIPDKVLDEMKIKYQKPDPYKEIWIDELIVVRL